MVMTGDVMVPWGIGINSL
eukprot:Gb_37865 [translate_table: standard]